MARPIVPAGIEIVVFASQWGNERRHVLHASAGGNTPTAEELLTAATTVMNSYRTHLSIYHNSLVFEKIVATDISQLAGQSAAVPFPANTVGAVVGQALPGNVSAVVSINSTHGGRSGHGRIYVFGLPIQASVNGDGLEPGYKTNILALYTSLSGDMTLAGLPMCVFSRKNLALYPWQGETMDSVLDSQRRRLTGRGR